MKRVYTDLAEAVDGLSFGQPVTHVYNPLVYAWDVVGRYLDLAAGAPREVLFLGMNPGPWGMAQTGVPFGTVSAVRDWMKLEGRIGKPPHEHPRRPVKGFGVEREEISGERFWGWAKDRYGTPQRFFERFFVANYCPLLFLEASGRNRTPDKLKAAEREPLFAACDEAFWRIVDLLEPQIVIGVGQFAENKANAVLLGSDVRIGRILHPSPASPVANRGWQEQAESQLAELGI